MTFPSLYLIADPALYIKTAENSAVAESAFFQAVSDAIDAGVRWIQYRDKKASRGKKYDISKTLSEMTLGNDVSLIINDDIDLALAVDAAGVHLGQDDFPISMARQLLGPAAVIGRSTHTAIQATRAEAEGADYIGFGPLFETHTKENADRPVGVAPLRLVRERVSLPVYAIGGIQYDSLQDIICAGATGVAVGSALAGAKKEQIRAWQTCLDAGKTNRHSK